MDDVLGNAQFVIDPPEYVTFQIDSAGPKEALLTLTNTSDNTLAYKVKVSPKDKRSFTVQPSAAVVRRKAKIRFTMRGAFVDELLAQYRSSGGEEEPKSSTRFLLQILHLPPSFFDAIATQAEISKSVESEWQKIAGDRDRLTNRKLRVRFVFPRGSLQPAIAQAGGGADGAEAANPRQLETLREQFQQLKKLESQHHDVCRQYTASMMENKKLRRQIEDKNKVIDELRASVVEKTGLRERFSDSVEKSGLMAKAESFRRFGLFQIIIVAVSCFMLGRLLSRR